MSKSLEQQLEVQRVQTLYEQSSSAVAANLLCALGVYFVLPKTALSAGWLTLLIATLLGRAALFRAFSRVEARSLEPKRWFTRYGAAIAWTGTLWGVIGVHAIHTPPLGLAFFTIAVLVGLVGGSVATCAVSPAIFLAFTTPTLVPPSVALIFSGDRDLVSIGILVLCYGAVVTRSVRQIHGTVTQSIAHRLENESLLEAREREKATIEASEKELRGAYEALEATHSDLVEQRSLVDQERDVSARLREVDRLKDEFLANTSHELRTPLYGIVGLAESLADGARGPLPPAVLDDLSMIAVSGRRLSHLVNDILDFSKLRHKSLTLRCGPVDLAALTDVVLTLGRPLVGTKDLELRHAVPRDLPPVWGDEDRLQQILYNLLGNAIKFTDSGHVTLFADRDGDALRLRVEDTGVGIEASKHDVIFQAFEQVDASTARPQSGTGLGLAITRQLVELHGGTLELESAPGQGSTFTVRLPVATAEELAGAPRPGRSAPVDSLTQSGSPSLPLALETLAEPDTPIRIQPPQTRHRVLAVDDEPVNLRVLQNFLAGEPISLDVAASGREALERLERESFDLLLLDVMMPHMSGFEVCQQLRERHALSSLPIIFLTAKGRDVDVESGLSLGANDFLVKPISKGRLLSRLRLHLDLLGAHRSLEELVDEKTSEVKALQGLLPICASCKKIRDDDGEWNALEDYFTERSDAQFSHGLCPDCLDDFARDADF
ncbi:MAG: ATP-binding protein [Acidobacteriota bacterium]